MLSKYPLENAIGHIHKGAARAKKLVKAKSHEILKNTADGVERDIHTWLSVFGPRDTGRLVDTTKMAKWISEGELIIRVRSPAPYAGFVNDWTPPIHWTNPMTEYHYFRKLFEVIEQAFIPDRKRQAMGKP